MSINLSNVIKTLCIIASAASSCAALADEMTLNKQHSQYTKEGQLIRPHGYREWIFIGAPLTPNDMNNGKAAFPEFHNVYIDPDSWNLWKENGQFRDGTVIVKELVSVAGKQAPSGNGYFQGEYIGLEAMVKSKQHFPQAHGYWGFFRFTIEGTDQLRQVATAQPQQNCLACHQANAAQDQVFLQYYPVLRAAKATGPAGNGR